MWKASKRIEACTWWVVWLCHRMRRSCKSLFLFLLCTYIEYRWGRHTSLGGHGLYFLKLDNIWTIALTNITDDELKIFRSFLYNLIAHVPVVEKLTKYYIQFSYCYIILHTIIFCMITRIWVSFFEVIHGYCLTIKGFYIAANDRKCLTWSFWCVVLLA